LSDTEYEQLFIQLLDGVHQGWSRGRVEGFLIAKNLTQADLVAWLQRFGEKLLESPQPNDELAQRMVLLSQVGCGELGKVSGDIGRHLLSKAGKPALTNSRDNADIDEAEAWFNQGYQRAMAGDFVGALASFDKAVQINPDCHEAWYNRGVALVNLGQFEVAIASFDKAVQINPDDHDAWYNRGLALDKLGQFEVAIASFDKAVQINPDDHDAWYNRGAALADLGHIEEAIASFDKALQIKLDDHNAWYNRGVVLDKLGQFEVAIASYDKALQIKADKHKAWRNRGIVAGQSLNYNPHQEFGSEAPSF
jgi:tetratricopeptide (TPR) repeat protein